MRDDQPNKRQLKIELLSQWKLEAESRNFFLPSLVTYRAVRDLISETKKFATSEDLRFANSEDFTFLMPCCIGCSVINKINRHLICHRSPHLGKNLEKRPLTKTAVTL